MIFCTHQQLNQERLLERKETASHHIVEESSRGSWPSSIPPSSTAKRGPSLPSPGTPISILEFAKLPPSEQKKWQEGRSTSSPTSSSKKKKNTHQHEHSYNNSKKDGDCSSERLHLPASSSLDSISSVGSSNKTEETDSLSSVSSSRANEQQDENSSATSFESETYCDHGGNNKSAHHKRSIFARYWAKQTGTRQPSSSSSHSEDEHTTASTTQSAAESSSPLSPPLPRRSIFGLETQSPQVKSKSILEIPTLAPRFVYVDPAEQRSSTVLYTTNKNKKARSTSALLDPPKASILKSNNKGAEHCSPRQRRHSFSVTFDSKVDVVLFNDPPAPYQESSPWWLRLVLGGRGGSTSSADEDEIHQNARYQSRRPATTSSNKKATARPLLSWDSF
jgi:hypothetical protein